MLKQLQECATVQDWSGLLKLETDFALRTLCLLALCAEAKVLQLFLRRRKQRHMLAFEVMYFLRQFPKASKGTERPKIHSRGAPRHASGHQRERGGAERSYELA